jgi:hypothetical protein
VLAATQKSDTHKEIGTSLLHAFDTYKVNWAAGVDQYFAISHLIPTRLLDIEQSKRLSFRQFVGYVGTAIVKQQEYEGLMGAVHTSFWECHAMKYPTLADYALFCASLPLCVTECDSILSMEENLFRKNQSQMRPELTSAMVRKYFLTR